MKVFHCADASYTVFQNWIIGETHIKTLCGLEMGDAGPTYLASYRRSGENDLIFGYRTFCEWLVSDKVPTCFTFCEKCLQSPDMALRLLGCLDDD